jgi:hypothetical protein
MTLIALTGYARAGKDTVGRILLEEWGSGLRVAFADVLREMAYALDPFVTYESGWVRLAHLVDEVGWDRAKTSSPDVRRLLQRLGTEAGREVLGTDIWVDTAFERKVVPALGRGIPVVITDCRFPNEAEAVTNHGGEVWRIVRPGAKPALGHVSDRALDDYPVTRTIHNLGDMTHLRSEVQRTVNER